jgi:hypothetical protein
MNYTVIDATSRKGVRNVISNRRVITGYTSMAGIGLVPYEGALERDFLELRDFGRNLSYAGAQPLRLVFKEDKRRRYTPDFLFRFNPIRNRPAFSPALYEVKGREQLREEWLQLRPGFQRAAHLCRARGWRFRIVTERIIRVPRLKQIKFLRGFLDRPDHDCIGQILYRTMNELKVSTPAELLAASFASKDRRLEAIGILWKLVADGRIKIDLSKPLNMETPIWSMWHDHR